LVIALNSLNSLVVSLFPSTLSHLFSFTNEESVNGCYIIKSEKMTTTEGGGEGKEEEASEWIRKRVESYYML
jgi:hypothetical protein